MKIFNLLIFILIIFFSACGPTPETVATSTPEINTIVTDIPPTMAATPLFTSVPANTTTSTPEVTSEMAWITYHEPNLRITFEYPKGWTLTPSTNPQMGSPIVIVSPTDANGKSYSINIGQYANETINPNEKLIDWTTARDQNDGMVDPKDRIISSRESVNIGGLEAVYTVMKFPEVRYTDIRRGENVLFVWANISDSADTLYQNIYLHIQMSFTSD